MLFRLSILLFTVTLLSACAAQRGPGPQVSDNQAVLALLDTAHTSADQGRFPAASATLERALRIEPRNPALWHELAELHLREGNYPQAESLAARSNSWAGSDKVLRASNWRLISEARAKSGDPAGAQAALVRAGELAE